MGKKVAIITTHRANNFGAVLQAYSLVEKCNELGANAEILDWRCPRYEELYHKLLRRGFGVHTCWHNCWKILFEQKTRRLFEEFRGRIKKSRAITSREELASVESEYDIFITGSDQVWNPVNSAPSSHPEIFDRTYLLDFVKTKSKNSYAASIGVPTIKPNSIVPEFVKAWRTYDVISMREHQGAEYVYKLSGHFAIPVLDPVLLHDSNWWGQRCKSSMCLPEKFVFEYNVNQIPELNDFVKNYVHKSKCKLVRPIIPAQSSHRNVVGFSMGPNEFVTAIQNSTCVFSSSFHCAAFACIFRKKLYLAQRVGENRPNSRYDALYRYTGVMPKIVKRIDDVVISCVDFSLTDSKQFELELLNSIKTLNTIISQ